MSPTPTAGEYELIAPFWEEYTSKPGEPLDFVRHRRGDVVTLSAAEARRLIDAGAVKPKGQPDPAPAGQEPSTPPGQSSATGSQQTEDGKPPKVDAVKKDVGDDPAKARAALDAELALDADDQRSTLIKHLEAVIKAAEDGADS